MDTAKLVADIKAGLKQTNASRHDEVSVMQSMLSDEKFIVTEYTKDGPGATHCPARDFQAVGAAIITKTCKIPAEEAANLMSGYSVSRTEAESMVDISKDFIHTYLGTGRKLPLGGRQSSNISLTLNKLPETVRSYPRKGDDGKYTRVTTTIAAHDTLKVSAPCPPWAK